MSNRLPLGEGNGHYQGLIDIVTVREGCSILVANPQKPPPHEDMPVAITDVLKQWMAKMPVRVLHTLPITKDGNTVALFVWWERVESPTRPEPPAGSSPAPPQ